MTKRRDIVEEIYRLLPAVHQIRDAGKQHSLKHLLTVVGEQVQLLHDDVDQLYDNWFIETCEDWVVPYIADLVGVTSAGSVSSVSDPRVARFAFPRREIANTVRRRRRKGTLSVLEDLAFDIAGWKARAVDFSRQVVCTQPPGSGVNFGRTADAGESTPLAKIGTPFDDGFHTPHSGELDPYVPRTWYGIGKLGLFVWRRNVTSITRGCLTDGYVNPAAVPMPLYVSPQSEDDIYGIAGEQHLPTRLTVALLADSEGHPLPLFYGPGKSLNLEHRLDDGTYSQVSPDNIRVRNLTGAPAVAADAPAWPIVDLDPETGQVLTAGRQRDALRVTCHYAMSGRIGGGEYDRRNHPATCGIRRIKVPGAAANIANQFPDIIDRVTGHLRQSASLEFGSSELWSIDSKTLTVPRGQTFELRARAKCRPVIRLSQMLTIRVQTGARLIIDGLIITGSPVEIQAVPAEETDRPQCQVLDEPISDNAEVFVQHSTLQLQLASHKTTGRPFDVQICHSVIQGLTVPGASTSPSLNGAAHIRDSVIDGPTHGSIDGADDSFAACDMSAERTTFLQPVRVERLAAASDCLFVEGLQVRQRQKGFLRYSYVAETSQTTSTPVRFRCVSDTFGLDDAEPVSAESLFYSREFGQPGFAQVRISAPEQIRHGAESESEMGAFHDQFAPQLMARLEQQLKEYTPAEMTSRVICVEELEEGVR